MNCIEIDTARNFISYFQNFILVFLTKTTIYYLKLIDCLRISRKLQFSSSNHLPSFFCNSSNLSIWFINPAKDRTQEDRYSIFVASEQRLDVSMEANIQPAATKVTNMEYLSSWVRQLCLVNQIKRANKVLCTLLALFLYHIPSKPHTNYHLLFQ